jgi:YD repeat-containing protein
MILPSGFILTYQYNSVQNRTVMIDPDGNSFTYTYDADNRLTVFTDPDACLYTFHYDPTSNLTTLQSGLGSTRVFSYDPTGRKTTIVELNAALSPISTLVDAYDGAGRKTSWNNNGTITTYSNDNANRLTGQQLVDAFATFAYDPVGNVLVKNQQGSNPISMTYNVANQIVTSLQGASLTTYTFDKDGNKTVDNINGSLTSYSYDPENRLTQYINPVNGTSTYSYDGDGLRRNRQDPGGSVTLTIWDGLNYIQERA